MNRRYRRIFGFPAILVFVCVGCGGEHFDYGQVRGTVTLDRKPLAGVLVYYYPVIKDGDPVPPSSSGVTDAAGNYELMSRTEVAGAVIGPHKVVVMFPPSRGAEAAKRPKIPQDYTLVAGTPLQFDVKPGPGDYPIALTTPK
jgi:hypothetical protein